MTPGPAVQTMGRTKKTEGVERLDTAVKLDAEVIRKAKIVAAFRGMYLNDYLSQALGSFVDRELDEEYAKEAAKRPKGGKSR